jgi:hypothetical protein
MNYMVISFYLAGVADVILSVLILADSVRNGQVVSTLISLHCLCKTAVFVFLCCAIFLMFLVEFLIVFGRSAMFMTVETTSRAT